MIDGAVELMRAALRDELGHLATTIVLLFALLPHASGRFKVAALAGSVLIDLDHIPQVLGSGLSGLYDDGITRPATHSLATVAVLSLLSCTVGQRTVSAVIRGFAFGVSAHLLRDLATGGVILFWPISTQVIELWRSVYLLTLGGCIIAGVTRYGIGRLRGPRSTEARE